MRSINKITSLWLLLIVVCSYCNAFTIPFAEQDDSKEVFILANKFFQSEEYHKAIELFSQVAQETDQKNPDHIEATKKIALSYASINDAPLASDFLEKYLKKEYNTSFIFNERFDTIKETTEFKEVADRYLPSFDIWTLLYLYTGFIGLFIALVLNLKRETDRIANLLIGLFIFLHSLFIIHISLYLTHFEYNFPHSLRITATFSYLYGPLLYFYFKRTAENYRFKKADLLHLLPFVLFLAYMIPSAYALPVEEKLNRLLNRERSYIELISITVTKAISLIVYGYLIYKTYMKITSRADHKRINAQNLKWQKNIIIFNTSYIFFYIVYGLIITGVINNSYLIHPQVISMSLLVLYVGYSAYVQPGIFHKPFILSEEGSFPVLPKYKNSGLTHSLSQELKNDLISLFNEAKIYRENNITLDILSEKLGTTRHNTSQVINEHFKMNFFELLNKFRIQEAKAILESDHYKNFSIINIAYEIGYNNKVTFNKAFKKETGLTPTQYIEQFSSEESVKIA
ncbi:helix-turn-helix domain-containing protein [Leptobacterium flavescens]|uniref:Helix-turn-helix domain-containing protein n=1 Tax=Leptobacterium flavescens TaxID=472055 RepID=A0A6P0UPZ8_9FLAO|nr:helix-turn-helix domain-containing protein [Leptobacterium flavescens]NER15424.1 helix-turn-helix domain-containing protein [Leptobacterium flavescens]